MADTAYAQRLARKKAREEVAAKRLRAAGRKAPDKPAPKVAVGKDINKDVASLTRRVAQQGEKYTPDRKKSMLDKGLTAGGQLLTFLNALDEPGAEVMHHALGASKDSRKKRQYAGSNEDWLKYSGQELSDIVSGIKNSHPGSAFTDALQGKSGNFDLASDYGWEYDPNDSQFDKIRRGGFDLALNVVSGPTSYISGGTSAATKSVAADTLGTIAKKGALSLDDAVAVAKYSKPIADDVARATAGEATELIGKSWTDMGKLGQSQVASAAKRSARDTTGETLLHTRGRNAGAIINGMSGNAPVSRFVDEIVTPAKALLPGGGSGEVVKAGLKKAVRDKAAEDTARKLAGEAVQNSMRSVMVKGGLKAADSARGTVKIGESYADPKMKEVYELIEQLAPDASKAQDAITAAKRQVEALDGLAKKTALDVTQQAEHARLTTLIDELSPTVWDYDAKVREAAQDVAKRMSDMRRGGTSRLGRVGREYSERNTQGAVDAVSTYIKAMRKLAVDSGAAIGEGDVGAGYVMGVRGKANKQVLREMGVDASKLRGTEGDPQFLLNPITGNVDVTAKKAYANTTERIELGKLATETDLSVLAARRIRATGDADSAKSFVDALFGMGHDVTDAVKADPQVAKMRGIVQVPGSEKWVQLPSEMAKEIEAVTNLFNNPAKIGLMGKMWDWSTNYFKSWALATPGFFMRNAYSNIALMQAHNAVTMKTYIEGWTHQALRKNETHLAKYARTIDGVPMTWRQMDDAMRLRAVTDSGQMVELGPDDALVKAWTNHNPGKAYRDLIHLANSQVENSSRTTAFMTGVDRGLNFDQAADFADRVLYDYNPTSLTAAELKIRRYAVPFYTWIRRNLPNQISIAFNDPAKINRYKKLMDAGYASVGMAGEDENMPEYMREMGLVPYPTASGEVAYFNPNFGQQDLMKLRVLLNVFTEDSLAGKGQAAFDEVMAMVYPFIKTPLEVGMNRDTFYQSTIREYDGQLVKAHPFIGEMNRRLGYKWLPRNEETGETLVSPESMKYLAFSPGIYNILRWTDNGENDFANGFMETTTPKQRSRLYSSIFGIKTYPDDSEKWATDAAYDDKAALNDILKRMRDQGTYDEESNAALSKVLQDEAYRREQAAQAASPEYQAWKAEQDSFKSRKSLRWQPARDQIAEEERLAQEEENRRLAELLRRIQDGQPK